MMPSAPLTAVDYPREQHNWIAAALGGGSPDGPWSLRSVTR